MLLLLAWLAIQEDLGLLIERLDHDDPALRDESALRLIELGERAAAPLRKKLESAGPESRARILHILESPYSGLDRKAAASVRDVERRHAELIRLLNEKNGEGIHGSYHRVREDLERELWGLLEKLPRYPGAARLLLTSIDDVYLKVHSNGYHGWTFHHPYFDCAKAVVLADRLLRDHPGSAEEALWTQLYCFRLRGLEKGDASGYVFDAVKAQLAWKPDPAKAREAGKNLLEKFPKGPYAIRVAEWLKAGDEDLILPRNRGYAHPFVRGEAGK